MSKKIIKLFLIFGTRPEAIKLAPLIKKAQKRKEVFDVRICTTGQHRYQLDQVLDIFEIKPDYDLNIMKSNQDLFIITTNIINNLKKIIIQENPDIVIVQGDTSTSFIAGLSAFYLKIPVAHVEAGLRTYKKYNPFPEEKNRHLLSVLADYHFSPTEWSRKNLIKENIQSSSIWVTGNTVIDALYMTLKKQQSRRIQEYQENYFLKNWEINPAEFNKENNKLVLVTGHRRENFGEGFKNICFAIKKIAETQQNITLIYPVHLNPNVKKPVNAILRNIHNVHLIEPINYDHFVFLMNKSYLILTDSGGIQEEGPALGKPVLVMRKTTERPEGVEAGVMRLVGTDKDTIVAHVLELLNDQSVYIKMSTAFNPYGEGQAAEKILDILQYSLSKA